MAKLTRLTKQDTKGWKVSYRFTPSDRRRTRFLTPDGGCWEEVGPSKATHVRHHRYGLTPTYLRRAAC